MDDQDNQNGLIASIPGEVIGAAIRRLPSPELDAGRTTRQAEVELPDGRKVRLGFVAYHHKRGKSSLWFWRIQWARSVDD